MGADADRIFALIASERRGLADTLAGLDADQWATPSLCAGWTVRDVVGHLVVAFEVSVPALLLQVVRNLGNFDRAMDHFAREKARRPTDDLVETLRRNADHRFTPPGSGPEAPLTDIVVHGEDIRRPLGIRREIDPEPLRVVLDRNAGGAKGFVPKARVAGLRFVATDLEWSKGTGAEVRGPGLSLAVAICGRRAGLDDCEGDGVATLRDRLP